MAEQASTFSALASYRLHDNKTSARQMRENQKVGEAADGGRELHPHGGRGHQHLPHVRLVGRFLRKQPGQRPAEGACDAVEPSVACY